MKYKILFVIPSLAGGGAERVFSNIVNHLDDTKFDITLAYLSDEKNVYAIREEVKTINLNSKRLRNAPFKILKLIWKKKPDLIVSTSGHMNSMIMLLKFLIPRQTKIITRQTNIASFNFSNNRMKKKLQRKLLSLLKFSDNIICQSEYMKEDLLKFSKVEATKVSIIFNPVNINEIVSEANQESHSVSIETNQINIFFAGRLNDVKRVPLIIDAFQKFLYHNNNANLYILGEGPQEEYLKKYVQDNRIEKKVKYLGFQKNPYKWLKHADLFLLASKHEGMPNILIEVIALGIPILVLEHPGGTIDIIKTLKINERFVNKLEITESAFNKYDTKMSQHLQKSFGIENIIKQYEQIFLSVLTKE